MIPTSRYSHPGAMSSPECNWGLLLSSKIQHAPIIGWHKTETSALLVEFLYCHVCFHVLMKEAATWERPTWQGIEGSPSQQPLGTQAPSPTTHKKLNSSSNHVSLEGKPSGVFRRGPSPGLLHCSLAETLPPRLSWNVPRFLALRNREILSLLSH